MTLNLSPFCQAHTLLVLTFLIPKLLAGLEPHKGEKPSLLLTVDEVQVMKGGGAALIAQSKRKPVTRALAREVAHLTQLKTMLDQYVVNLDDEPGTHV